MAQREATQNSMAYLNARIPSIGNLPRLNNRFVMQKQLCSPAAEMTRITN